MRSRLAWLLGFAGLVAFLRRRRPAPQPALAPAPDPAEELRRRLEARREEPRPAPEAEPPAPAEPDLGERRRQVHEAGRAAVDEMRRDEPAG